MSVLALEVHPGVVVHHIVGVSPHRGELRCEGWWFSLVDWTHHRRHYARGVHCLSLSLNCCKSSLNIFLSWQRWMLTLSVLSIKLEVLDFLADKAIFGMASVWRYIFSERIDSSVKANISCWINAAEYFVYFTIKVNSISSLWKRIPHISQFLLKLVDFHLDRQVKIYATIWWLTAKLRDIVVHNWFLCLVHRNVVCVLHTLKQFVSVTIDWSLTTSPSFTI